MTCYHVEVEPLVESRLTQLSGYSVAGTRKTTLGYDAATGRLATMDAGGEFAWEYLAGTDLKSALDYPNGARTEYTYESGRDLLTNVRNEKGGTVYSNCACANDAVGRRTAKNGEQYGYNARSELISAAGNGAYAYLYDDIGNRVTSSECGTNATYTANSLNQYTEISTVQPSTFPSSIRPRRQPDARQDIDRHLVRHLQRRESSDPLGAWRYRHHDGLRPPWPSHVLSRDGW